MSTRRRQTMIVLVPLLLALLRRTRGTRNRLPLRPRELATQASRAGRSCRRIATSQPGARTDPIRARTARERLGVPRHPRPDELRERASRTSASRCRPGPTAQPLPDRHAEYLRRVDDRFGTAAPPRLTPPLTGPGRCQTPGVSRFGRQFGPDLTFLGVPKCDLDDLRRCTGRDPRSTVQRRHLRPLWRASARWRSGCGTTSGTTARG
jgi:hypothetical protein